MDHSDHRADRDVEPTVSRQDLGNAAGLVLADGYVTSWRTINRDRRVAIPNSLPLVVLGVDREDSGRADDQVINVRTAVPLNCVKDTSAAPP